MDKGEGMELMCEDEPSMREELGRRVATHLQKLALPEIFLFSPISFWQSFLDLKIICMSILIQKNYYC